MSGHAPLKNFILSATLFSRRFSFFRFSMSDNPTPSDTCFEVPGRNRSFSSVIFKVPFILMLHIINCFKIYRGEKAILVFLLLRSETLNFPDSSFGHPTRRGIVPSREGILAFLSTTRMFFNMICVFRVAFHGVSPVFQLPRPQCIPVRTSGTPHRNALQFVSLSS